MLVHKASTNEKIIESHTLIRQLNDLPKVLLQDLQCPQLFLFVLDDRLRRNKFLGHARGNQDVVFFRYFYPTLLGVELANPNPVPHLLQVELLRLVSGKLHHIQPGDCGPLLTVCFEYPRRAIKESFEPLDQYRAEGSSPQVPRHTLVSLQYAVVVGDQRKDGRHGIIFGDKGEGFGRVSGKVVDLEMIRMRLRSLDRGRILRGRISGKAPLSFRGGVVALHRGNVGGFHDDQVTWRRQKTRSHGFIGNKGSLRRRKSAAPHLALAPNERRAEVVTIPTRRTVWLAVFPESCTDSRRLSKSGMAGERGHRRL